MNEHEAIAFLRTRLGKEGQIVLPQVRNGTGFQNKVRTADALVVETWPSRGIGFTGVEYKRSVADWRHELKNPEKAEEISQYCKHWVILAPKGIVPLGEVPANWGLWEIWGKQLRRIKAPPVRENVIAPTPAFVCSILRANADYDPSVAAMRGVRDTVVKQEKERWAARVEESQQQYRTLYAKVRKFEMATGISVEYENEKLRVGLTSYLRNPETINNKLGTTRDGLKRVIEQIDAILD